MRSLLTARRAILASSLIAAGLLLLASWLIQEHLAAREKVAMAQALATVLDTTHQALRSWQSENRSAAVVWANTPEIKAYAARLLTLSPERYSLVRDPAQAGLRNWLRPVLDAKGYVGYLLISPAGLNLASSHDENLGVKSLLFDQEELLEAVQSGMSAVSVPQPSEVALPYAGGSPREGLPTMFVVAPILDAGAQPVALFAFRIDPVKDFVAILQRGRLASTGETYAFDGSGRLISESRFDRQLLDTGLIAAGEAGALNIEIRDPGVNLLRGERSPIPRLRQPLTVMAASALRGESGTNVEGYRDYRGVPVAGAWLWDDELAIGITTEIDVSEAFAGLRATRLVLWALTGFAILLLLGLAGIHAAARRYLLDGERRLRQIIDLVPSRIFARDAEGRYLLANKALAEDYGTTAEGMVGLAVSPRPSDTQQREATLEENRRVIESGQPLFLRERSWMTPHGDCRILQIAKIPFVVAGSEAKAVLGVAVDVTELKNAEAELAQERDFVSAILDTVDALVLVVDAEGRIVRFNKACEATSGYDFAEVRGRRVRELFSLPEEFDEVETELDRRRGGRGASLLETDWRTQDGERRLIAWVNTVLIGDEGEVEYVIGTGIDITEQRRAEERSKHQQAQLAHVSRLSTMSEMVAGIAHELTQPLGAIDSYGNVALRLAERGELDRLRQPLERICTQVKRAADIIQRLRKFVIRQGPEVSEVDLNELVRDVIGFVDYELRRHRVQIHLELDHTPPVVAADELQIQQVLVNLLLNAVQAMSHDDAPRRITVRCDARDSAFALITVSDTGPGIAAEELERVFEPFQTSKATGMGIGLAISRTIVEGHGGKIWAESEVGKGASFMFTLPLES